MASFVVLKQLRAPNVLLNRFAAGSFRPTIATDVVDRFSFTRKLHLDYGCELTRRNTVPRSFKREEAERVYLFVDMPGMTKKDVDLTVLYNSTYNFNKLVVTGKVLKDYECECRKYSTQFRLPENVKASGIKADMEDGVLKITLPKLKEIKKEKETIQEFKVMVN